MTSDQNRPDPNTDARSGWRISEDPVTKARILAHSRAVIREVHLRRVRAWGAADTGEYPSREDSQRLAMQELGTLCRALGDLCAIEPADLHDLAMQRLYGDGDVPDL